MDYVLEPYSGHSDPAGQRFLLQQRSNMSNRYESGSPSSLGFYVPVASVIALMARRREISETELATRFQQQYKRAYSDMVRTGEGHMPDFGMLYTDDESASGYSFKPGEELAGLFDEFED